MVVLGAGRPAACRPLEQEGGPRGEGAQPLPHFAQQEKQHEQGKAGERQGHQGARRHFRDSAGSGARDRSRIGQVDRFRPLVRRATLGFRSGTPPPGRSLWGVLSVNGNYRS